MNEAKLFDLVLGDEHFNDISKHYEHEVSIIKSYTPVGDDYIKTYSLHCHNCEENLINFVTSEKADILEISDKNE